MTNAFEFAADLLSPRGNDGWEPLPHQIAPAGKWYIWLLLGGRGAGKTATAAHDMHEHVMGPPCLPGVPGGHWPGIIAPTLGDGVTSCVNGPSGLRRWCPEIKVRQTAGGTVARWPNGCEAKIFGAHTPEDVERLRSGGNRCYVWAEELAAWRYLEDCWQHMRYGLRVGPWPHIIISTTPKPWRLIKGLIKRALEETGKHDPYVVITKASTKDNPHLDKRVKDELYDDYEGTRLGRQELDAELLEEAENALWKPADIENHRILVRQMPKWMRRMSVNIDPAATENGDEHGITVTGAVDAWQQLWVPEELRTRSHFFVLADYSFRGRPEQWANKAVDAYYEYEADVIVAEKNNGGDMVEHTIRTVDDRVNVKLVSATRGKAIRAEPVSAIYQQGRGHHVGVFEELEDQMTSWDPIEPDPSWSPDRMDSLVWGATELITGQRRVKRHQIHTTALAGRR